MIIYYYYCYHYYDAIVFASGVGQMWQTSALSPDADSFVITEDPIR